MTRGRVRGGTVYVEASVELDEVLENIDTDLLVSEVKRRNRGKPTEQNIDPWPLSDFLDDMRALLLRRSHHEALALLEQYAAPRVEQIEKAYPAIENAKAMSRA